MRALLVALAALISAPASAALIQIDITVQSNNTAPSWTLPVPPGEVKASLLLDTSAASATFVPFSSPDTPTCIGTYRLSNISMTVLDLSVGGQSIMSGVNSITGFGGDRPGRCSSETGQFFFDGGGQFSSEGAPFLGLSMDTAYEISLDDLAGAVDPVAMFLLSRSRGNGTMVFGFDGLSGAGFFGDAGFSIREVPEPGTLALFAVSLLGVAAGGRARRVN